MFVDETNHQKGYLYFFYDISTVCLQKSLRFHIFVKPPIIRLTSMISIKSVRKLSEHHIIF